MQVETALRAKRGRQGAVRMSETGMTAARLLPAYNIGSAFADAGGSVLTVGRCP